MYVLSSVSSTGCTFCVQEKCLIVLWTANIFLPSHILSLYLVVCCHSEYFIAEYYLSIIIWEISVLFAAMVHSRSVRFNKVLEVRQMSGTDSTDSAVWLFQ